MGLDIRKPIGLLFAIIAAELIVNEGIHLANGGGASIINTWCALGLGSFGFIFLWLGRRRNGAGKADSSR